MRLTWMSRMAAVRVAAAVSVPEEPKGCWVSSSRAAPMETSFIGCGRKIHADVGPAHVAIDTLRDAFDVEGGFGEGVGELLARGVEVLRVLEYGEDGVGGLERDGELVAEAGDVGGGIERSQRADHGGGGETKIGLAAVGVFQALDDAGGGADGAPADAVIGGDDEAGVDGFGAGDDFGEDVGLGFGVVGVEHGGADVWDEILLGGEIFVVAEELDGLLGGEAFGVFGERLGGDADALHGVAAGFEERAGVL